MDHLLIAIVGGTLVSALIAYILVYGKNHLSRGQGMPRSFEQWRRAFDHLVQSKSEELSARESRPGMGALHQQAPLAPDKVKMNFLKLSSLYRDFNRSEEQQYFETLAQDRETWVQACKKRSEEFKRKWGHQISDHYLKERFLELCEVQAFIQNKHLELALALKDIDQLWEAYAGLSLLFDDARLGSSTVAVELEKKMKVPSEAVYRGLEFWFMAKSGQSKKSLLEGYLKKPGLEHFQKSQRLAQMKKDRLQTLMLSLCFPAKHKIRLFPELLHEAEQAIREVETYLAQGKSEERPPKKPAKLKSKPDDFAILGLSHTQDIKKIKKAYHKMAMRYHPDRLNLKTPHEQKQAHEAYVEIQKAYERLEKQLGNKSVKKAA